MLAGRQALELKTLSIRRGSEEREGAVKNTAGRTNIDVKPVNLLATLGSGFYQIKSNSGICVFTFERDAFSRKCTWAAFSVN